MATSVGVGTQGYCRERTKGMFLMVMPRLRKRRAQKRGTSVSGTSTGMGAATRGGKYTSC